MQTVPGEVRAAHPEIQNRPPHGAPRDPEHQAEDPIAHQGLGGVFEVPVHRQAGLRWWEGLDQFLLTPSLAVEG